jgi:hypothetical protein
VIPNFKQLTMQIHAFLKATLQLVSVVLYVRVMALSERTEWEIFRKAKGGSLHDKLQIA